MDKLKQKRIERHSIVCALYTIDLTHCHWVEAYKAVELSDFVVKMVEGVMNNLDQIDEIITKNLTNWTLKRLNYVDRAIIRLAVYEMVHTDLPKSIIINEAVELSKNLTETDDINSKAFNNKLLDKIHHALEQ